MKGHRSKGYEKSSEIRNVLLAVALLMGFVFIVSLALYSIKERYGMSCSCGNSLITMIAVLVSLGVFVGILTYYFFSRSFSEEKEKIFGNIEKTLDFLDREEKSILMALIESNGEIAQNNLSAKTCIDPVKLHRRLTGLEKKGVISKTKNGMTNNVLLKDDFKDIFMN